MKLNVKNDITFGTNILDLEVPKQLRNKHKSGLGYIDSALGGDGFTPSAVTFFTGEPGSGKTTMMLTLADAITRAGGVSLFNTAEESLFQVKLVVERLKFRNGFIAGQVKLQKFHRFLRSHFGTFVGFLVLWNSFKFYLKAGTFKDLLDSHCQAC